MIEYNQMIDACHMARSHNLSALIEAEEKAAGALSTRFLLSSKISAALLEKKAPNTHCAPPSDSGTAQKYALLILLS